MNYLKVQHFYFFFAVRLTKMRHISTGTLHLSPIQYDMVGTLAPAAEKILTADLADNTTAVFQLLSATLTQGNMSRLGRCELNPAA